MRTKTNNFKKLFCLLLIFILFVWIFLKICYSKEELKSYRLESQDIKGVQYYLDYLDNTSYVIKNTKYNCSKISQKVRLEKNTIYKFSCDVKVQDLSCEDEDNIVGASLYVGNENETPPVISQNSFEHIELVFDTYLQEELELGLRFGNENSKVKGKAKFSNIKLEKCKSVQDKAQLDNKENVWNIGYFVFKTINSPKYSIQTSLEDEELISIKDTINRFKSTTEKLSNGKLNLENHIIQIDVPIKNVTKDEKIGYYLNQDDIYSLINKKVEELSLDYIFVIYKMDEELEKECIGIGNLKYFGIPFSNIKIPANKKQYYSYTPNINEYPEEIFMIELLHHFEDVSNKLGYETIPVDKYEDYGYKNENMIGLQHWIYAYLNNEIKTKNNLKGLNENVFLKKQSNLLNVVAKEQISVFETKTLSEKIKDRKCK